MTSLKVGLKPSYTADGQERPNWEDGLVECLNDPDRNGVFKITNTSQKFVIKQTRGSEVKTQEFDLSGLVLEPKQ